VGAGTKTLSITFLFSKQYFASHLAMARQWQQQTDGGFIQANAPIVERVSDEEGAQLARKAVEELDLREVARRLTRRIDVPATEDTGELNTDEEVRDYTEEDDDEEMENF
jgi:hypothetical protein